MIHVDVLQKCGELWFDTYAIKMSEWFKGCSSRQVCLLMAVLCSVVPVGTLKGTGSCFKNLWLVFLLHTAFQCHIHLLICALN